jgi:lipopolysaccharide export system protein LptA
MFQTRKTYKRKLILSIFVAAVSLNVYSLPQDMKEKLRINADSTIYNYKNGVNFFEGHVQIDQGTTHVTADKLTTKLDNKHHIQEAVAYGVQELAHFWTVPKLGDPAINAHAKVIKFYPQTANATLLGDVVVTQGGNNFHGQLIHYNMNDQTIIVPATKNGRAVLVYNPD